MNGRAITSVLAAAAIVAATSVYASSAATSVGAEEQPIVDAVLEWSVSDEANTGAFNGQCNFMSAGTSDGSAATYTGRNADATVLKRNAAGVDVEVSDYASRCDDADGVRVTAGGTNRLGQKVRYEGGTGRHDPATGAIDIAWSGTFSINFYGSLVPFWFSDPALHVDSSGVGTLTADMGGYSSTIDNPDVRELVEPRPDVVVATFSSVEVADGGLVAVPDYEGVEVDSTDAPQIRVRPGWGSWPLSFVSFMDHLGMGSYWYSSGGAADARKAPAPVVVGFSADTTPVTTTTTTTTTTTPPTTTTVAPTSSTTPPSEAPNSGSVGAAALAGSSVQPPASVAASEARRPSSSATRRRSASAVVPSSATVAPSLAARLSATPPAGVFGWVVDASVATIDFSASPSVGQLGDVVVLDGRDGLRWTLAANLNGAAAGTKLGWAPLLHTGDATAGEAITAAAGRSSLLASTLPGHGGGAASVGASVELHTTAASPGVSGATLTITALG